MTLYVELRNDDTEWFTIPVSVDGVSPSLGCPLWMLLGQKAGHHDRFQKLMLMRLYSLYSAWRRQNCSSGDMVEL